MQIPSLDPFISSHACRKPSQGTRWPQNDTPKFWHVLTVLTNTLWPHTKECNAILKFEITRKSTSLRRRVLTDSLSVSKAFWPIPCTSIQIGLWTDTVTPAVLDCWTNTSPWQFASSEFWPSVNYHDIQSTVASQCKSLEASLCGFSPK